MPESLLAGYRRFRQGYYREHRDRLEALADGQSPRIAVVSCCDSRVDPGVVFDARPGDLFVIRNVASLVPPFESEGRYHGTSAASPCLGDPALEEAGEAPSPRAVEQAAVRMSLRNLGTFPWIADRLAAGSLSLHGWYYDLSTSTIEQLQTVCGPVAATN